MERESPMLSREGLGENARRLGEMRGWPGENERLAGEDEALG